MICAWCSQPLDNGEPVQGDHIIPRSRGGPDEPWNRQVLHRRCNLDKGAQVTDEARALAAKHGAIIVPDDLPPDWEQKVFGEDDYGWLSTDEFADLLLTAFCDLADQIANDPHRFIPIYRQVKADFYESANVGIFAALWVDRAVTSRQLASILGCSRQAIEERARLGADVFQRRLRI